MINLFKGGGAVLLSNSTRGTYIVSVLPLTVPSQMRKIVSQRAAGRRHQPGNDRAMSSETALARI
jgi:hypothetical protein